MTKASIALAVAVLATAAVAQSGSGAEANGASAAYTKLTAEFAEAGAKQRAAVKTLTESEDYKKAVEAKDRGAIDKLRAGLPTVDRADFGKRALAAAEKESGEAAARLLAWVVEIGAPKELANPAIDGLIAKHVGSRIFADFCGTGGFLYGVATLDPDKRDERFSKIRDTAKDPLVKAWASYAWSVSLGRSKDATEEQRKQAKDLVAEALALAPGTDLADRINAPAFAKERLQVGMVAPDIQGEDLDGVGFKLSDYRGKVVVLDFWGDW